MEFTECPACRKMNRSDDAFCAFCGELLLGQPADAAEDDEEFGYVVEQIGSWSQIKHELVEKYAKAYTTVLSNQPFAREIIYVDAFAGTGVAEDRATGELVFGSAIRAFDTKPPFTQLHLIEQDPEKAETLKQLLNHDKRVYIHVGDCVTVLPRDVLPLCEYKSFARALCLLDPYGLTVPWALLERIGKMRSVEIFFNFMVVGANRNVLWRDPSRVSEERKKRLDYVWGDRSWEQVFYRKERNLFGDDVASKKSNEEVVEAFRQRLSTVAEFAYVPKPVPIRNLQGATIYYLFFASPSRTGAKIVEDIFRPYQR